MKTKKTISLAFMFFCMLHLILAQESEIKHDGIVFPVMSSYPVGPSTGQVIYYTGGGTAEYQYFNGSLWQSLGSSSTGVSDRIQDIDGDTYIQSIESGSNDYHRFYVNGGFERFEMRKNAAGNLRLEVVDNTNYNLLYGNDAGSSLSGGISNICIGEIAGNKLTTGSDNVIMGRSAGYNLVSGTGNTMLGRRAGYENEKDYNTFVGYRAASRSDSSRNSISIGAFAGENTEGDDNVFIGYASGQDNEDGGEENVAIGNYTLQRIGKNKTSTSHSRFNVAVGHNAGKVNDKGYNNVFVGKDAGELNSDGYDNTFVGLEAGSLNSIGHHNTFIGKQAGAQVDSSSFNTMVGYVSGFGAKGNNNTYIGENAGRFNEGTGNVFLGHDAGWNVAGGPIQDVSNRLVITNDRNKALVYGEFDNDFLRINGDLQVDENNFDLRNMGSVDNDLGVKFQETANDIFGIVYDGAGSGGENRLHIREYIGTTADVMTIKANGNIGIGIANPSNKLDVNGTIKGTSVFCGGINACSDVRFKKDFSPIDHSLKLVQRLNGYYHFWKDEDFPEWDFGTEREIGFKAQEVQEVLPELVAEMDDGMLGVDYSKLVPVLVEAIKAQQLLIDDLYSKIDD